MKEKPQWEIYSEELNSTQWKKKRRVILKRDNYQCQTCGLTDYQGSLHVHHRYYVHGCPAWEYDNDALITLCEDCHFKIHKNNRIKVYTDFSLKTELKYTPCLRCNGMGYIKEYLHIRNGICFRCMGLKYEELINKEDADSTSTRKEQSDREEQLNTNNFICISLRGI